MQQKKISRLQIRKLVSAARLPERQYEEDVGWDLFAYCLNPDGRSRSAIIPVNGTRKIETKIAICPPDGFAAFVYSRSGLAGQGVVVANAPGVIDPGYRGDVSVLLYNGGHAVHYVRHEDRVAQLILLPIHRFATEEVKKFPSGGRDQAGFGSTGR